MDNHDIRDALHRVTPELTVPDGMVAGARRRRQRTQRAMASGVAVAVVALAVPLALSLGGGTSLDAGPANNVDVAEAIDEGVPPAPEEAPAQGSDLGEGAEESARDGDVAPLVPDSAAAASSALAAERLGWDVLLATDDANRLVSPSSLSMSLVQVAEGADGASLASIDDALGQTGDTRRGGFAALRSSLEQYDSLPASVDADDPPETPVVHQASRVLAIDAQLKEPFLQRIAEFYDATAETTSLPAAKANLDAWAKQHTAGLIEKSGIEPGPNTVAVLQDALLFAAAWQTPFTSEPMIDFGGPDGTQQVQGLSGSMMVRHAEGERWSAVRLPYDDQLAADVILPKNGLAPTDLTADDLAEASRALKAAAGQEYEVTMPALDLTVKTDLKAALPAIDLTSLGGIYDGASVDKWIQQAKLIVTARGTVGAALTEVGFAYSVGEELPRFIVDRPYVFRVVDTHTAWPLFLAAISDPGAQS